MVELIKNKQYKKLNFSFHLRSFITAIRHVQLFPNQEIILNYVNESAFIFRGFDYDYLIGVGISIDSDNIPTLNIKLFTQ